MRLRSLTKAFRSLEMRLCIGDALKQSKLVRQVVNLVMTHIFALGAIHSSSRSDGVNLAVGFNPLSLPKLFQFESYARTFNEIV
jgi:hypothetical protein